MPGRPAVQDSAFRGPAARGKGLPCHGLRSVPVRPHSPENAPHSKIASAAPGGKHAASALRAQNNRLQRVAHRNGLSPALRAPPRVRRCTAHVFSFRGPEKGSRPATARKALPTSPAPVTRLSRRPIPFPGPSHPARPVLLFPFPSPLHSTPPRLPTAQKNALRLSTKRAFLRSLRPVPRQSLRTEPRGRGGFPTCRGIIPPACLSCLLCLFRLYSASPRIFSCSLT